MVIPCLSFDARICLLPSLPGGNSIRPGVCIQEIDPDSISRSFDGHELIIFLAHMSRSSQLAPGRWDALAARDLLEVQLDMLARRALHS